MHNSNTALALLLLVAVAGSVSAGDYVGTPGNDILTGTGAADNILGYSGDDKLYGNGGDDDILGGLGKDKILGGPGLDVIVGGGGADYAYGGVGNDDVSGAIGNDKIAGQEGWDILKGGPGNDNISGGPGGVATEAFPFEQIFPGQGHDMITLGLGANVLSFTGSDLAKDIAKGRPFDVVKGFSKTGDIIKYEGLAGFFDGAVFSGGKTPGTTTLLQVLPLGAVSPTTILQVTGTNIQSLIDNGLITFVQ